MLLRWKHRSSRLSAFRHLLSAGLSTTPWQQVPGHGYMHRKCRCFCRQPWLHELCFRKKKIFAFSGSRCQLWKSKGQEFEEGMSCRLSVRIQERGRGFLFGSVCWFLTNEPSLNLFPLLQPVGWEASPKPNPHMLDKVSSRNRRWGCHGYFVCRALLYCCTRWGPALQLICDPVFCVGNVRLTIALFSSSPFNYLTCCEICHFNHV